MDRKDEISISRIGGLIRKAYLKLRQPIAVLLVLVAYFWKFLPGGLPVQVAALGTLGLIILTMLFEIYDWTQRSDAAKTRRFNGIAEAIPAIKVCLRAAYRKDHKITIQWIGMTMANVWITNLEGIFDWLAKEVQVQKVTFDVAMLDKAWLNQNIINRGWTGQSADDNAGKILGYFKDDPTRVPELRQCTWAFEVRRYAHMPMLHGGLVNGRYLFLGISRWEGETVKAGDRLYELYRLNDGDEARDKIEVFQGWFSFCFKEPKPNWYPTRTSTNGISVSR